MSTRAKGEARKAAAIERERDTDGIHPVTADILPRDGKPYIWTPVPRGLPRYSRIGSCYENAARAVLEDERLFYVEGAARRLEGSWIEHAWVTLDHVHAIDLTWRSHMIRGSARARRAIESGVLDGRERLPPGDEYVGIEIPRQELAELIVKNNCYGSFLPQWRAAKS